VGRDWKEHVKIDPQYYRPTEVDLLIGDPTKAKNQLGWKPKCSFKELVQMMVREDIKLAGLDPEKFIRG
jgi:GDPmannose 4,6-dehydratase